MYCGNVCLDLTVKNELADGILTELFDAHHRVVLHVRLPVVVLSNARGQCREVLPCGTKQGPVSKSAIIMNENIKNVFPLS